MLSDATRPPWLYQIHKLEEFVEKHNWTLSIVQLRCDRNRCQLVDDILEKIALQEHLKPSEFEKGLARNHLAVDLQNILQSWCGIGLKKTMEGSALLGGASTTPNNRWPPICVERINTMPKVEVTSPDTTVFSPRTTTFDYVGNRDYQPRPREILPSSQQPPSTSRSIKRQRDDVDQYDDVTKIARIDRTSSFTCPYYALNEHSPDHAECANKTFPNPRKLKEHVWRWLKPFKCSNCGEGFGREKTRAIHCEQRKTKCKKAVSTYEQSAEYRRDQQIESAKSTQEMIRIFKAYEKEITEINSQNIINQGGSSTESEGSCSSPESQNDSDMDGLREDPKYGPRVEIERGPPMTVQQHSESLHQAHNLREGSDSTLEGLSPQTPQDCFSRSIQGHQLSPVWQQEGEQNQFNPVHTRRKSEPSYFPSMSSNNFPQESSVEAVDVPKILVTHHEPSLNFLSHANSSIEFEPQLYQMPDEISSTEPSYMTNPMNEEPQMTQNDYTSISQRLQLGNRSGPQRVLIHSNGYGSVPAAYIPLSFSN